MSELIIVVVALAVSVAVIPVMMRFAPRLGMIDVPDPRKVHARPVPRVGGLGIALGAMVAMLLVAPRAPWLAYYAAGAAVLIVFGALDDSREMGHYAKFIGQFLAVMPLVWLGDVWVASVPFLDAPLPPELGKPFTTIAIVGVVNAVNHSDGLDGLAAGESVLSLGGIAYLAYLAGDLVLVLLCFAVLGGVFGFLRFNTHPARVFMGDAGSQFLGFSLGVFVVVLTQRSNSGLSMALPALLLGLPIIDILAVFYLRASGGMNWFRATRNHIHHRLLGLGFDHYQAVVVIYAVQAFFIASAILFRYESDAIVLALYLVPCAAIFAALTTAEQTGWRARRERTESRMSRLLGGDRAVGIARALVLAMGVVVPAYFVAGALAVRTLPDGTWPALAGAAALLGACLLWPRATWAPVAARVAVFSLAPLWIYGIERQLQAAAPVLLASTVPFYGFVAISVALVWKLSRNQEFAPTTMDFLVAALAVAATFLAGASARAAEFAPLIIKVVVLLYACELVLTHAGNRMRDLFHTIALVSALLALARSLA